MSVTFPTRDEILAAAVAYFQVAHRNPITGASPPLGPRTWTGGQTRALADLLSDVLSDVAKVDDDAIPGTYQDPVTGVTKTKNSSLSLERWAYTLGLPSSVPGVFGRRGARAARGGAATATGTPGVVVTTGAQLTDPSGKVVVQVRAGITVDANPALNGVVVDAFTLGTQGNLPAGTRLRWTSAPPGLASTVVLTTGLTLGADVESDVGLALRLIDHLTSPLRGGTAADYRFWAENAEDTDGRLVPVDRAYPLPGRNGTGTIDVVITQSGTGAGRDPGATVAAQVQAWVDSQRPVGDGGVRILRPSFEPTEKLSIRVRITPSPAFRFDWDDGQGAAAGTVSTGSTGTSLVLSSFPGPLQTAVDAGSKPRIQLTIAGLVLPFVARVLSYLSNTLTLDTALPADPGNGASVYAGGPAVLPVAAAVLAYVNSVGPSRSSGYAPAGDTWSDAVTVAQIGTAAILATDPAGQPVCVTSQNIGNVASPVLPGVLIKVGSGSFTSGDFQLYDNDTFDGPQLPEMTACLVHRGGV